VAGQRRSVQKLPVCPFKPCMRRSSQIFEHQAGKNAVTEAFSAGS